MPSFSMAYSCELVDKSKEQVYSLKNRRVVFLKMFDKFMAVIWYRFDRVQEEDGEKEEEGGEGGEKAEVRGRRGEKEEEGKRKKRRGGGREKGRGRR